MRRHVVMPGNHDGVHRGHQALIQATCALAAEQRAGAAAMFFDPHPSQILAPAHAPEMLTHPCRRRELLRAHGVESVSVLRFDSAMACLEPETFVRRHLLDELRCSGIVIGEDFRFGRDRRGDVALLRQLGQQHDFVVHQVPAVFHEDEVVSSTRVRSCLSAGRVRQAADLLARVHDVQGMVHQGARRGRSIGFPTANLGACSGMLPADGVYAGALRVLDAAFSDRLFFAMINLGPRPTVDHARAFEVHIFDFDADIYAKAVRVGFVERLRGQQKFASLPALKQQLERDREQAKAAIDALADKELAFL